MRAVKSLFHAGWIVVVMAALLLGLPKQAKAQGGFDVSEVQVSYRFGEQITFQARIQSPAAISQASILFRETNESLTRV